MIDNVLFTWNEAADDEDDNDDDDGGDESQHQVVGVVHPTIHLID